MIRQGTESRAAIADSHRWQRLKSMLVDALEQESPAARTAFLERSCLDDTGLLREAESLLAETEVLLQDATDDLEECADRAAAFIPREDVSEIGQRIGAYMIIREIGQGGMGSVYLGARADGYFQKQVAIKLLKRGNDSEEVLRRFRAEREVLARLDHPNIARIIDAGTSESGRPYFVMEYIEGTPITRFVEEDKESVAGRLNLFLKICGAVEAAHRNSIVHRDLKPSNILVNHEGEPKLLDFGIAKLIGNDADPLERTAFGQERLTPISASPEQAQGEAVTISSDIYALGVVLYEMLTGVRPHRFQTPDPSREELVHVICDQLPTPPSQAANDREKQRQLRGDLDAIVLRALQKEPAQRYPSVAEFGEDIRRHLAGQPVQARRDEILYWIKSCFLNRRVQILAAVAGVVLLCLGIIFSSSLPRSGSASKNFQKIFQLSSTGTGQSIPEKSIAVLPFDNFSTDKEDSYLVDGVQDNILTDLARVADLKVISRTSVAEYRGVAKNSREIGQALGVSHVLEGSVQKSGDRIRVNARLIDTRSQVEVWAEHYDRKIEDLFALQSELAETIVSQLKATLSPTEKAAIETPPTTDLLAYDLYLRAREAIYQYNGLKTVELLNAAVARDSHFALGYALLAEAHLFIYRFMGDMTDSRLAAAKEAAEKALQLAPDLAESHLAKAQYYYYGLRDFEKAQRELTALAPSASNNGRFMDLAALTARRLGNWRKAIENGEKAMELDPHNPFTVNELVESYIAVRNFSAAEQLADKAIKQMAPQNGYLWNLKSESFISKLQLDEARAVLESSPLNTRGRVYRLARVAMFARDFTKAAQLLANVPPPEAQDSDISLLAGMVARAQGNSEMSRTYFEMARSRLTARLQDQPTDVLALSDLGLAEAGFGRKEEALRASRRAVELVPISRDAVDGPVHAMKLAQVYAWMGEKAAALDQLIAIVKIPNGPSYGELRADPAWDEIRTDPKFQEILRQAATPPVLE